MRVLNRCLGNISIMQICIQILLYEKHEGLLERSISKTLIRFFYITNHLHPVLDTIIIMLSLGRRFRRLLLQEGLHVGKMRENSEKDKKQINEEQGKTIIDFDRRVLIF